MSSSSMSFTNRRQIWSNHNQHPLRRYKSLYIDSRAISPTTNTNALTTTTITNNNNNNNNLISEHSINGVNLFRTNNNNNNNRTKYSNIKKQTSVDQILCQNNNNNNNNQNINEYRQSNNQSELYKNINNNNNHNIKSQNFNYKTNCINTGLNNNINNKNVTETEQILNSKNECNNNCSKTDNYDELYSEINTKTITETQQPTASDYYAKKKQPNYHRNNSNCRSYGDNKKEKNTGSQQRKSSKNSVDDKVNLNIFLSQNIISSDIDDDDNDDDDDSNSSDDQDNSSASNRTVKSVEIKETKENLNTSDIKVEEVINKPVTVESSKSIGNYSNFRKPLTASARRALFRASKDINTINYSTSFSPPGYKDSTYPENINKNTKNIINDNKTNLNSNSNNLKNNNNKRPPSGLTIRIPSASITTNRITSAKKSYSTARITSANNRITSAGKRNNTIQSSGYNNSSIASGLNNSNINNQLISEISAAPSLIVEKRPPLIRAMSAPIRTLDENSKNILANKRKPRRRKIFTRTQITCVNDNENNNNNNNNSDNKLLIESTNNYDENDENFIGRNRNRKNTTQSSTIQSSGTTKNTLTRSRSTIGIDVVTLVSLISSEESDSEKEDLLSPIIGSPIKRAPPLRKSGKSVSFQENQGPNTTREYTHMLRRGSIAPLAAKLRSNRPPTAPPVSIFLTDIEQSTPKMDEKSKSCSKEDLSSIQSSDETKENSCSNKNIEEETYQYPEFVKSLKERECWKLFQTMTNKGVAVSYETVLRGLLTPTELRQLLAKRKEIEMAQQRAQEIENAAHEEEIKKNHKNKSNN